MRSSTFTLATLFALVASVAAAPVLSSEEVASVVAAVEESSVPVAVDSIFADVDVDVEDVSEVHHALEKRTQKCANGKAATCKQTIPSNAYRVCSSKVCTWVRLLLLFFPPTSSY
jgi:uncharacterized protein YqgV (UPF0045/DUF77 family)